MTSRPHQSRWGEEAKAFGPGEVIFVLWPLAIVLACVAGRAADTELRAVATETNGVVQIEYLSGNTRILGVPASAPAGVELLLPGSKAAPVQFRTKTEREGIIELGPARVGALTLRWRLHQETPALVQRTLEVNAEAAQRFSVTFPLEVARDGEFITFSGPAGTRTLYDTVRGSARTETFPVVMLRTSGEVFGLVADSPSPMPKAGTPPLSRPSCATPRFTCFDAISRSMPITGRGTGATSSFRVPAMAGNNGSRMASIPRWASTTPRKPSNPIARSSGLGWITRTTPNIT